MIASLRKSKLRQRFCSGSLASLMVVIWLAAASPAFAHVSEQSFVLLLPTGIYTAAGVAAVALTVLLLTLLPAAFTTRLFHNQELGSFAWSRLETITSLVSLGLLVALLIAGLTGSRDPLVNPLPLVVWTLWWVGFVTLQAFLGDLWRWVNPWTGLYRLLCGRLDSPPLARLPEGLGAWPGVIVFLAFGTLLLVDLAPDDPARLAAFVAGYWFYSFAGMVIFGAEVWLSRGECFTMLLRHFAALSPLQRRDDRLHLCTPGWRLVEGPALSFSGGLFILVMLGTGSFDGLNETFWWLARIGINPLEFPGRSAVILPNLLGLMAANALLVAIFAGTVWSGLRLAGAALSFATAFGRLARSVLPIALGYHIAHYLTVLLVNGQYALVAASDPFGTGADYLGLGRFYVSTGFLNSHDTVELIWLCQAGAIVLGHILAVLVSHAIALDLLRDPRKASLSLVPMAVFMILYTLLGLTLLASPRGV